MPQPDYVIVLVRDGKPQLVFGEHDRGTESREVVAREFRIYQTWKETPDIAERIFGSARSMSSSPSAATGPRAASTSSRTSRV